MKIRVLLFGGLRGHFPGDQVEINLDARSRVEDLLQVLERLQPVLRTLGRLGLAVNEDWSAPDRLLKEGDVLALLPPVSGG